MSNFSKFDDFVLVNQLCRNELIHILESIEGTKDLVIEANLIRPIDKIASMSMLQRHNVGRVQQLSDSHSITWLNYDNRCFIIPPNIKILRRVCDFIKAEPTIPFSIIFVPRLTLTCETELEKNGLYGIVKTFDFEIPFISIETDLFSMEITDNICNPLLIAKNIIHIQSLYGTFPVIHSLGGSALEVQKLLKNYHKIYPEYVIPSSIDTTFQSLLIFDRYCDIVPVLLTSSTYESLLHNTFGISCGKICFGKKLDNKLKNSEILKGKSIALNNSDTIFATVRNKHISDVFPYFSAKAKHIKCSFDKISKTNQVAEVKKFVSNELASLKTLQKQLEMHISASELILDENKGIKERLSFEQSLLLEECDLELLIEYIEEGMLKRTNFEQILLLMSLASICQNGIPSKYFLQFKNKFLRAYGYEYLPLLHSLQQNNILYEKSHITLPTLSQVSQFANQKPKVPLTNIFKIFNLTNDKNKTNGKTESQPQPNYVFNGIYTPLIIPILKEIFLYQTLPLEKLKKIFNNQHIMSTTSKDININSTTKMSYNTSNSKNLDSKNKPIVVYFLSGVTYAEIAAIRYLGNQLQTKFIIISTHIISRENFITQFARYLLPTNLDTSLYD
ncbi:Vacuolar protein sorting-associated protein 33B [Strongyloides ratti]|uniref:Vacuolar protein sorting-associated protein 33B n=1 Tax=Strongyloides ratti TaxID=34506 RepID=A0A090L9S4_STRRB|nr:Vacuolar protein sorting-associated protein 33B [Strongyloides ratti]CEF64225.1 Vacuolar protein sorting-associated protein 33B [Strongyloides ratti]